MIEALVYLLAGALSLLGGCTAFVIYAVLFLGDGPHPSKDGWRITAVHVAVMCTAMFVSAALFIAADNCLSTAANLLRLQQ